MLEEAREYLSKLQLLKEQQEAEKDKEYVQLHIEILTYLIDCAEQVEDIIYQDERQAVLEGLYVQKERYKEVLEFYADEENYKPFDGIFLSSYQNKVDEDGGEKARQALEGSQ